MCTRPTRTDALGLTTGVATIGALSGPPRPQNPQQGRSRKATPENSRTRQLWAVSFCHKNVRGLHRTPRISRAQPCKGCLRTGVKALPGRYRTGHRAPRSVPTPSSVDGTIWGDPAPGSSDDWDGDVLLRVLRGRGHKTGRHFDDTGTRPIPEASSARHRTVHMELNLPRARIQDERPSPSPRP